MRFQVEELERDLRAGREPGVVMLDGHLSGHQVRAYDMEPRPDGGLDIFVYDPNRPFVPLEDGNGSCIARRRQSRASSA